MPAQVTAKARRLGGSFIMAACGLHVVFSGHLIYHYWLGFEF